MRGFGIGPASSADPIRHPLPLRTEAPWACLCWNGRKERMGVSERTPRTLNVRFRPGRHGVSPSIDDEPRTGSQALSHDHSRSTKTPVPGRETASGDEFIV